MKTFKWFLLVVFLLAVAALVLVSTSTGFQNYLQLETAKTTSPVVIHSALELAQQNQANSDAGLKQIETAILLMTVFVPLVLGGTWFYLYIRVQDESRA